MLVDIELIINPLEIRFHLKTVRGFTWGSVVIKYEQVCHKFSSEAGNRFTAS
jgi:hypothetical protein